MGRILALDYGLKRTGIAVTDPLKIIANKLTTIPTNELLKFLENYINNEKVEEIVIGYPMKLNNQPAEIVNQIDNFVKKFKIKFPEIDVKFIDERFTSKLALQAMIEGGVPKNKRKNKELTDAISAVIILQSYLEMLSNKNK